jgi:hypothetical protein
VNRGAGGRRELHDQLLDQLETILAPKSVRIRKIDLVRVADVIALHGREGSRYEAELTNRVRAPVGHTRTRISARG